MQDSFMSYKLRKQKKINAICKEMRKAKERKRLGLPSFDYPKDLPDPLYTLAFTDHIINKTYVFTLHQGKQSNSFRIDVNGQPFRHGGWSKVLEEIRKKRIRIESLRRLQ